MRSLLVLALGGCSAFMTPPPHSPHPGEWIVCTESNTRPLVDNMVSVAGIGGGIAAWILVDDHRDNGGISMQGDGFDFTEALVKTGAVIAIITGVVYGFSSVYGYVTASKCRQLKAARVDHGASLSRTQPDATRW
jgi:hypothetical protein